ncbi:protein-disulfide reductase DsbD domain-containing protein [uncultured Maritimibacter sp.]|uniref:protein-disulfide reductase DsbD domain-containing protein n=1 Tax=uncultured Maritimibacter sp. TaxID=991866 RepID=UPI0026215EFD|nr:protein-disulfide reductase DsbD domain-containing protein [uncultured Maritimibacter sp.]
MRTLLLTTLLSTGLTLGLSTGLPTGGTALAQTFSPSANTTTEETLLAGTPARVSLLPGWRMENGNHMAALRVVLADGWKTYWRAPGEGGIPPDFDWSGSANLGGVTFHWPVPEVIGTGDLETIGYRNELILPIEITPEMAGQDVELSADLLMGICEHICVPLESAVAVDLSAAATVADPRIEAALAQRPDTKEEAGVTDVSCTREDLRDGVRVTARMALPAMSDREAVVFEASDPAIWVSEAMEHREGTTLVAVADLVPPTGQPFPVAGNDLRFTVLGAGRGVDIQGCDEIE